MPPIRALRERETRTWFDRSGVEIYPTPISRNHDSFSGKIDLEGDN
jgi:hypothetical protein